MMSVTTMPTDGSFDVSCKFCGHDFKKTPKKIMKGAELHLLFCHQCKESQLLRDDGAITTIFKVIS